MRSQIWKISRRLAALKSAYRPHVVETRAPRKSLIHNNKIPHALKAGEQRSEARAHIVFLAGDIKTLKNILRREMNLPVREKILRCTLVPIERSLDLHALAVMRALKQSLELNRGSLPRRPANEHAGERRAFSFWKH
jgi:hypothetical protein